MARVICQRWLDKVSNQLAFSLHHDDMRRDQYIISMRGNSSVEPVGKGHPLDAPGGWSFDHFYYAGPLSRDSDFTSWPLLNKQMPVMIPVVNVQVPTKQEEKKPMSEEKRSTKDVVKDSFKEAMELSASRATNKLLATLVLDKTGLSLKFPVLATEKGRAAFETALPIMIHTLATNVSLPKADVVAAASEQMMKMAMTDGMGVVMDELVAMILPFWADVVALFENKGVPGLPEGEKPVAAGEASKVNANEPVADDPQGAERPVFDVRPVS